jgi:phage FluMu protein Com
MDLRMMNVTCPAVGKIFALAVCIHYDKSSCPFCRSTNFLDMEKGKALLNKKVQANDARAMQYVACMYSMGENVGKYGCTLLAW